MCPPPKEALMDSMDALFYCLKNEENAAVRAILGHYMFVYIHPYIDGNGRIARLLMNSMFLSGGYSWTIVHEKNRDEYLNCLETITADQNFLPFVLFLKEEQNREHL
ncbi:MAG: Adenosine monophosphate-protein transferase SoFic [Candidatus Anoxychlamydiales bacterium]|nr:Adenosine monophosphate-protein transferase SoFic [Candidatus Anoxychlamydiales bacterium]